MKFIVFGVHEGELEAYEKWQARNNIELKLIEKTLNLDTIDLVKGYDGICLQQMSMISDEIIYQKLNEYNIKQIALRTAGYDMIDFELAKKYQIKVTNVPAYSPNAIAEMALTHTMYLTRKMYLNIKNQEKLDLRWSGLLAREVRSLTIGIIGVGRIGGLYAKLVSSIGAKVIGYDIAPKPELNPNVEFVASLEELLKQADVVSIHTPTTPLTTNMINKDTLTLMKDSAYFINTARGAVVNSSDLVEALNNKVIAGAGIDVINDEEDYFNYDCANKEFKNKELLALLKMDNVLVTPHTAFYTNTALENMVDIGLDSALAIITTGKSQNIVSK